MRDARRWDKERARSWYGLCMVAVVGIDLAGAPPYGAKRFGVVGLAALRLDGDAIAAVEVTSGRLGDGAILDFVRRHDARAVAIDAPLSLPRGRCCADPACGCARFGIVREAERDLVRRGYRPYWTLLPSMTPLTLRGIALRRVLEQEGREVIEVFPGAVRNALGVGRRDDAGLLRALRRAGLRGVRGAPRRDTIDALAAAWVAALYTQGACEAIGPPDEGQIWLPLPPYRRSRRASPSRTRR
jgi:predicted nuclease with RNAse H fold